MAYRITPHTSISIISILDFDTDTENTIEKKINIYDRKSELKAKHRHDKH